MISKRIMFSPHFFANFLWTLFFTSGGLLVILYTLQNLLVYVPYAPADARTVFDNPAMWRLTHEEVFVDTPDGESIQCWLLKVAYNPQNAPTLLFFHGNAGNLSHRLPNIKHIIKDLKSNVFIVSYRGYGSSTGSPSEIGLKLDAAAALQYLQKRPDINSKKIILFGRSLGGAVATDLAAHSPVGSNLPPLAGVILENTFTSIYDMLQIMFPALKVFGFLCTNSWNSIQTIKKIRVPVLFVSGGKDEIVPPWMMRKLHETFPGTKQLLYFEKGQHMDTWVLPNYFQDLKAFIDKVA